MSGLVEAPILRMRGMVRRRLGSLGVLCQFAGVGRAHVSQILHGAEGRGRDTWARIRRHLVRAEWAEVEKSETWNKFRARHPIRAAQALEIPLADDPLHPLMPLVCSWCGNAMGAKSCKPEVAGRVSHGCCPRCAKSFQTRTVEALAARELFPVTT